MIDVDDLKRRIEGAREAGIPVVVDPGHLEALLDVYEAAAESRDAAERYVEARRALLEIDRDDREAKAAAIRRHDKAEGAWIDATSSVDAAVDSARSLSDKPALP